jgi:ABC-2 type transport system ATP-binding protein
MADMITASDVQKYYGDKAALDGVSFSIATGEVVGFLGLNGAGKTTMLKILCGLLLPTAGRVVVDGIDAVADPLALRRQIGFLPDRPPLYGEMTVREMLRYAGQLNGVAAGRINARVHEVLALADLLHVADDLVETLSHGYRQRVGIAQSIVHEPKLVILDEPISGLDPAQIVAMRSLIRGLKERHTVLLSSHILAEITHTADRILVLHGGKVVAQGHEADLIGGAKKRVEIMARGALATLQKGELLQAAGVADADASSVDGADGSGGLVRIRARFDNDDARERLIATLVAQGFGIRTVVDLESDLEALFLKLTGGAGENADVGASNSNTRRGAA